ncbi:hypothetical protein O181_028128 [Austropuccinia psidii MF-1]|uniref:MADS-box domain-containing protein n=1 Tax=Austropuccinia psidii MF-1 TaxID=1389203 RepID=A0A9Q3CT50_9BASI|nr:hypothetical protein [Austropuccinia psidii MF-1]
MNPVPGPTDSGSLRPKRPLPSSIPPPNIERGSLTSAPSVDLGGTLVPQATDDLGDLSTDSEDDDGGGATSGSKRRKGKNKSNLPRRQIKIEYIQDKSRRNITFGKRKNGIFKKAQEISTLTGCEVMLIVAPKDSELQAYTYATSRLQPLVSDPAGEAYIQNCLRYGALMPGTPSGMTGAYGANGSNHPTSHMSTLRAGPRSSPVPPTNTSHSSPFSYPHSNLSRRPQASYGMPYPLSSSPQSSTSTHGNKSHAPPINLSEHCKREASDSPVQHLGRAHPSVGLTLHNPISTKALASFQVSNNTSRAGMCYPTLAAETNPSHREPSDHSVMNSATWQSLSNPSHNIATEPNTAASSTNSELVNSTTRFLEPLVLSQAFDHPGISAVEPPLSGGTSQVARGQPISLQASLSHYGDTEHYENFGPNPAYLTEDGTDCDTSHYGLENHEQIWPTGLH